MRKSGVTLRLGNGTPTKIGVNVLLDFCPVIQIDDIELTEAEVQSLLEQSAGLALIKGKWVAFDPASLKKTLEAFAQAKALSRSQGLTFADAMRMLMGTETESDLLVPGAQIGCGEWLQSILDKMTNPTLVRSIAPSSALMADLRPYQQQGLNWLFFLHTLGFGICLADDMGLGKTVQVLALLQKIKGGCSLIVVPASLIYNWHCEVQKFTPDLKAVIIHPQAGLFDESESVIDSCDIAITTYAMLSRSAWISKRTWNYIICDEAQAIKNPSTRQTLAVKDLKSAHRLVMTGTPVENRITDLWSLFNFINPGLLGTFTEFKRFAKTLNDHPEGYGRLRKVVHPYILRRVKYDKSIINDLPGKVEMKTYYTLSKWQASLYREVVFALERELGQVEGIQRKGIVLGYLTKCKQLCNHPDHYAGSGGYDPERSGKFDRLAELCETIRDKREKVLVFTQFAEIIDPLHTYLESLFGASGVHLSGSTSIKARKEAVEQFQNGVGYVPYFILSLKAGGVGLNLTQANHVIHFDRWWNPAVENQATDRAYRIGQKRNALWGFGTAR